MKLALLLCVTSAASLSAQATDSSAAKPQVGPPVIAPDTRRDPVPGYDVGLSDSAKSESTKPSFLFAPIPFYNAQLGFGVVGVVGMLKPLGPPATTPASTFGLIGLGTTNGTWGLALGAKVHRKDDEWRLMGGGGYIDVKYTFFGTGGAVSDSVDIRQQMAPIRLDVLRRVTGRLYLGVRGQASQVSIALDESSLPAGFPPIPTDTKYFTEVLLAPLFQFDSRNDQMYPTKGWLVDASASFLSSAFGSDSTMQGYELLTTWQHGWKEDKNVIAASLLGCYATGQVPIDQLCFVGGMNGLRGYEAGRYMDNTQVTFQGEFRRRFGRFGFVLFGGGAQIARTPGDLTADDLLWAAGFGLRFQLIKKYPINYRVDLAFGKDDPQVYFSMGEAF